MDASDDEAGHVCSLGGNAACCRMPRLMELSYIGATLFRLHDSVVLPEPGWRGWSGVAPGTPVVRRLQVEVACIEKQGNIQA